MNYNDKTYIIFEMRRRGFKYYTSAREFVRGMKCLRARKLTSAMASISRVTKLDSDNPYGWAYMLFIMEDIGGFTAGQLADTAAKWTEAAIKYKYQGQDALATSYLLRYVKIYEKGDCEQ